MNKDIVGKSDSNSAMDPVPLDPQHFMASMNPDPRGKILRTKKTLCSLNPSLNCCKNDSSGFSIKILLLDKINKLDFLF